jgi:hypothetical protein
MVQSMTNPNSAFEGTYHVEASHPEDEIGKHMPVSFREEEFHE